MYKILDKIGDKFKSVGKDAWTIITYFATSYFILALFFKIEGLNDLFKFFLIFILGGLIILTIAELLQEGLKYISDKLAFYLSNIKEIAQIKKDIIKLNNELEELKIENQKQGIIINNLQGNKR